MKPLKTFDASIHLARGDRLLESVEATTAKQAAGTLQAKYKLLRGRTLRVVIYKRGSMRMLHDTHAEGDDSWA